MMNLVAGDFRNNLRRSGAHLEYAQIKITETVRFNPRQCIIKGRQFINGVKLKIYHNEHF